MSLSYARFPASSDPFDDDKDLFRAAESLSNTWKSSSCAATIAFIFIMCSLLILHLEATFIYKNDRDNA